MARINDVNPNELIEKAAEELKKISDITPPEWAAYVKTGSHKERPPLRDDWWHMRAAGIMRSIYLLGPIGVSKLRVKYGGKKNRGFKPERFRKSSGNIIRKILQQLESAGFAKQEEKGVHKGRVLTSKGMSFLDKIAASLAKGSSQKKASEKPKKKEPKK